MIKYDEERNVLTIDQYPYAIMNRVSESKNLIIASGKSCLVPLLKMGFSKGTAIGAKRYLVQKIG